MCILKKSKTNIDLFIFSKLGISIGRKSGCIFSVIILSIIEYLYGWIPKIWLIDITMRNLKENKFKKPKKVNQVILTGCHNFVRKLQKWSPNFPEFFVTPLTPAVNCVRSKEVKAVSSITQI
ncbi:hypothetical protein BpHYR1_009600 [Brachionus plicatilis]|uniref:Uncharacterized protein n=1 Tax=Brachionus plicatilis TaxID=10195 RepID=A0A3M7T667_BRAPC|nr:hypothetical protein BpHYR1_009600 [Brachionus plicatilis]